MSNLTKILVPAILLFALYAIYILMPTDEIGSFDKVRAGGEINQNINVLVNPAKGFDQDPSGNIKAFYATDINNNEALISLKQAGPREIATAHVVEILGHMHENTFVATRVTIVE
jgi:hypothetical protein